jgi:hypothetical protein
MMDYYLYKVGQPQVAAKQPYAFQSADYTPKEDDSGIDSIFDSKLDRTRSQIEALIEAIDRRKLIKEVNVYGIEKDLCGCQNLLFDLGYKIYRRDKTWEDLEKKKLDLGKERRMEEGSYFRDLSLLHKELRETINYYQSIKDKVKVLGVA